MHRTDSLVTTKIAIIMAINIYRFLMSSFASFLMKVAAINNATILNEKTWKRITRKQSIKEERKKKNKRRKNR